ncbi:MAG TPA: hypothetical protein VMB19_00895 [Silvibacterium sp.]|nr:hypothetical protein [Silvibacterium sp.]
MTTLNRRTFVHLSAGALVTAASNKLFGATSAPSITNDAGDVRVQGSNYLWEYSEATDTFRLQDSKKRLIVSGKMQPAVIVSSVQNPSQRQCNPGKATINHVERDRVTIRYEKVNGAATVSMTWRFDEHGIWLDPIIYDTPTAEDIVSLYYFSEADGTTAKPTLHATYLVVPGISEGSAVSPILRDYMHINQNVWLGRGSFIPGLQQQWALPVHYFCGFSVDTSKGLQNTFTEGRSESFTCGLADLPSGDLFLNMFQGDCSPWVDYRSDLWKHVQGPGKLSLGATWVWSIAPGYRDAIAAYYASLLRAGIIRVHENSAHKTQVALTPEFCTWGSQVDENKEQDRLDEAFLEKTYNALKASGLKAGLFSIDDKWEGAYGNLEHSTTRLPHFEQFLEKLRADGYKIGMWAALMRCERPADIGLTEENMLKTPDGTPYLAKNSTTHYYIIDFTQPAVEKVLTGLVKKFVRRYKPDLFKFDFGYELPAAGIAAPQDKKWTGERLMWKGLDIVIKAMREENPDLVVMYYQLSPLFLDYFDLHSTDDLFLALGEYDLEANRRIYFSSLLGPLGVPTYGSSGYDWASAPNIWFDSAASGTIGSLNDFHADEQGEKGSPEFVAKYNGMSKVLRPTNIFEVIPLGAISEAPTFGAHARSWARMEGGQLVLLAYRPPVPGEENALQAQATSPLVRDAIHSGVPVVVASRGKSSISKDGELALVAYGGGEISILRESGTQAQIVSHYFGGAASPGQASIRDGRLTISVADHNADGKPLEWIEIHIS